MSKNLQFSPIYVQPFKKVRDPCHSVLKYRSLFGPTGRVYRTHVDGPFRCESRPRNQLAKHLPTETQWVFKSVPKFDNEPKLVYLQGEPKKQLFQ